MLRGTEEKFDNLETVIFLLEELSMAQLESEDREFVGALTRRLDEQAIATFTDEEIEKLKLLAHKYNLEIIELGDENKVYPVIT